MTKNWKDIKHKASPEARALVKARAAKELEEMPLQELRRARELSQVRLAEILQVAQSEISKIEHRTDLYVSTVRSYVEAMGGELEIVARFPDGNAVRVTQFRELQDDEEESSRNASRPHGNIRDKRV